jgi:(p)ppGpp synthase/HD superfamily hydrolase
MQVLLELRAKAFATVAHQGQVRKYTGEPYINHPAAVVELVRTVPHTQEMLAAAWLHDVVEDTDTTLIEVRDRFGLKVAAYVLFLTDVSKPEDGNRATRKALDRVHLTTAPPKAMTIKLADLIHNTGSIVKYDPKFAEVYLAEKRLLLEVLTGGDRDLYAWAHQLAYHSTELEYRHD